MVPTHRPSHAPPLPIPHLTKRTGEGDHLYQGDGGKEEENLIEVGAEWCGGSQ